MPKHVTTISTIFVYGAKLEDPIVTSNGRVIIAVVILGERRARLLIGRIEEL